MSVLAFLLVLSRERPGTVRNYRHLEGTVVDAAGSAVPSITITVRNFKGAGVTDYRGQSGLQAKRKRPRRRSIPGPRDSAGLTLSKLEQRRLCRRTIGTFKVDLGKTTLLNIRP